MAYTFLALMCIAGLTLYFNKPLANSLIERCKNFLSPKPISTYRDKAFADIIEIYDQTRTVGEYDTQTGLPDRQIFDARLARVLSYTKQHQAHCSVMVLQIDEIKSLRDHFGEEIISKVQVELANRLRMALRQIDTLCKYVGDSYFILLPVISNKHAAASVAQRIQDKLIQPFVIESQKILITTTIGIATNQSTNETPSNIMKNAERALVEAKFAGSNTYRVYAEHGESNNVETQHANNIFADANYQTKLSIRYQPYQNIHDEHDSIIHADLFIHNEDGPIKIEDLYTNAENHEKTSEVCGWQFTNAFKQLSNWQDQGFKPNKYILTIPFSQLTNPNFITWLQESSASIQFDKKNIILDIINTNQINHDTKIEDALNQLSEIGMGICVSILVLGKLPIKRVSDLPIDYLKIDGSLVKDLFINRSNEPIISSLISLINNSDIKVIADGIDTENEKNKLHKLGCSIMRGELISTHLTEEAVMSRFAASVKDTEEA